MLALGVAFLLPLLVHSVAVTPLEERDDCNRWYTIQENDICDSISAAHNVSTYQLATVNSNDIDKDCGNLVPGNRLCLGYGNEDCTSTYVVRPNDTCEQITAQFSIGSDVLYANNPLIDAKCENIYIGQVLCVSKTVQVPAGPAASESKPATESKLKPLNNPSPEPETNADDDEDLPYCDEL
ncbi:hypothetical protein MIND_00598000 [Mycena indigotica]|uniref:LysM domain-containing protein n=1 Tax=Mycena indigotica TaxID=2126181 RepID=A0A8H6SS35_9AGAR|nr:uncharacterized protein MIND_00598000 [Mycena indigotica]KAF7303686.1 hypothetical protein MIND_00598000 [Mycena indigotica]